MRIHVLCLALLAACSTTENQRQKAVKQQAKPTDPESGGESLEIERKTEKVKDDKAVPKATDAEQQEFVRVWELFRKRDKRWPVERDRFKVKSEGAGYLLAGHMMKHYIQVNAVRAKAGKYLHTVKDEVVAIGAPCVPTLVNLMVLDRIPAGNGRYFVPDDLTRNDCRDMIERIGRVATPELLKTLRRNDLGIKGRRLALLTLGGTGDPRGLDVIATHLRTHKSWQVRADAAAALAKLGHPKGVDHLVHAIKKDPDPSVVKRAGKAREELLAKLLR